MGFSTIINISIIRSIIAKGPKYMFLVQINFQKCREKIAGSLNEFCSRWCKREHVECDVLKDWKLNIFKIIDRRISFYSLNTNMLPRKLKISNRYLKSGIEEFHRKSRKENPQKPTQLTSRSTSWLQQIKLLTTLLLFDGCTTLIL